MHEVILVIVIEAAGGACVMVCGAMVASLALALALACLVQLGARQRWNER